MILAITCSAMAILKILEQLRVGELRQPMIDACGVPGLKHRHSADFWM